MSEIYEYRVSLLGNGSLPFSLSFFLSLSLTDFLLSNPFKLSLFLVMGINGDGKEGVCLIFIILSLSNTYIHIHIYIDSCAHLVSCAYIFYLASESLLESPSFVVFSSFSIRFFYIFLFSFLSLIIPFFLLSHSLPFPLVLPVFTSTLILTIIFKLHVLSIRNIWELI